ncbi:MAG: hypothetical protein A2Y12_08775 [Planctomycetes bacterium GWF2_42_9]|nr:MAG: hypothetical protein A2Y12_08775 [Planctomycetes bacterium GWF2_42_9]HAL45491.1 hypothetical protein [Phycisphaerales bacterium]
MKIDKDIDVSDDYNFLDLLMQKHSITAKQLAGWVGRDLRTIYKYLSGELTIPSVIWRSIFDHTLDSAVFNIIRGDTAVIVVAPTNEDLSLDTSACQALLDMRLKQLELEKYVLQLMQDGQINGTDTEAIAKFNLAFPDMINAQARLHQAVIAAQRKFEALHARD